MSASNQVAAVGPASCISCPTSCFVSKLGRPAEKMEPQLARLFDELRGLFVRTDLAFRDGNLNLARQKKEEALKATARILEMTSEKDVDNVVFSIDSMAKSHAGSRQSFEFLTAG